MTDVTQILSQIENGDPAATEELLPLVYDELRKLAAARLANEKPGQTLQATALQLGVTYLEQNKLNEAAEFLKEALVIARQRGNGSEKTARDVIGFLMVLRLDHPPTDQWLTSFKAELNDKITTDEEAKFIDRSLLASLELWDGNIDRARDLLGPNAWPITGDDIMQPLSRRGRIDEAIAIGNHISDYFSKHRPDRPDQQAWRLINKARAYYQVADFEKAERLLRRARDVSSKIEPRKHSLHNWVTLELGTLLASTGRQVESKVFFQDFVNGMNDATSNGKAVYDARGLDRLAQWDAQIASRTLTNFDEAIRVLSKTRYSTPFGLRVNESDGYMRRILGALHEQRGSTGPAIEFYRIAAWNRQMGWSPMPVHGPEERLVELFDQTGQLDSGREFFADLIEHRRQQLPAHHPTLALTKIRLAKLIIRQGDDFAEAQQQLDEARDIMRQHKVSPQSVFDEIDSLAKSAEERQSDLAVSE